CDQYIEISLHRSVFSARAAFYPGLSDFEVVDLKLLNYTADRPRSRWRIRLKTQIKGFIEAEQLCGYYTANCKKFFIQTHTVIRKAKGIVQRQVLHSCFHDPHFKHRFAPALHRVNEVAFVL